MGEQDVIAVLDELTDADVTAWVDGGWGVEALLGTVSRPHSDLDLVVLRTELDTIRAALAAAGFTRVLRDVLPTALALADQAGREVDLHPVDATEDGGGDQVLPDGGTFHYPAPVPGRIGGHTVLCVDTDTQLRAHQGYPLTDKDRGDIARLTAHTAVR
ncbi:nucleotidyltransferase domain-containing protein [Streptomyces sp. NPDC056161]|uniref:nucleotidyltransferase domain-containing protein n=1 Tax=Streptomyces sp. NPDC056161 TaxID=3345732 RepID=UPI0035D63725